MTKQDSVYYNKKINMFCQVRRGIENGWICSQAKYYNDARTTNSEYPFSDDYIKKHFVIVNDISKFAVCDGDYWRVPVRGEKPGLVLKDKFWEDMIKGKKGVEKEK